MPSKTKFSKNRKLKSKMKGGNPGPGGRSFLSSTCSCNNSQASQSIPVKSKVGSSRDDFEPLNMKFFLYAVASIGVVGCLVTYITQFN